MSAADHEQLRELLSSYALGVVEGDDLGRIEEHLADGCRECEQELRELYRTVEAMAAAVEPVGPSEFVRAKTLGAIGGVPSAPARASRGPGWKVAAAAALALLAWSGWSQLALRSQVRELAADRETLRRQLETVQADLAATRDELGRALLAGRIVSAPRSRSILLAGLETAPDSSARAYVDPGTNRAVFYASNLAPLAAGETYQLWFIADGQPVSAGVFEIDDEGSGSLLVEQVAPADSLEAWAVTVEPAGGVAQPTGTMVLLGSFAA